MSRRSRGQRRGILVLALLFAFVLLNALLMLGAVFSPDVDAENRAIALFLVLGLSMGAFALGVGFYRSLFATRVTKQRWMRFNEQLHLQGFREATRAETKQTEALPIHLLAPTTLGQQRGGGIDHVTIGHVSGREVRCFNVRIRGGGWVDVAAVAIRVPAYFAPTVIHPFRSPIPPRPNMKRVRFEHEGFNRTMSVFSVDPFFATAMVDARMMEWLKANLRGACVELADGWVAAWSMPTWQHRDRGNPRTLVDLLGRFDQRIPRAVPSFFPERHERLMWPAE